MVELHAEVRRQQESAFLWRWLHCREDIMPTDTEWHAFERLRKVAEAQGMKWRSTPPAAFTDDQQFAELVGRPKRAYVPPSAPRKTGRPRRVKPENEMPAA
jgi:hypothetical protein